MKHKLLILSLSVMAVFAVSFRAAAQEPGQSDDKAGEVDSLQAVVNSLNARVQSAEQAELDRAIWKNRSKYFNIGYVNQKLTDKTYGGELKSDFGVSLSWGKTYYLHKKPLFNMMKIGLDWSWLDINYAKSSLEDFDFETNETFTSDIHQAEFGMQFGPSVTVNPVHHLKVGAYFRVTPSYSLLYLDETVHHHFVAFCNAGLTVAWKVVSVGAEWRWGTAKYDGMTFDESELDEDDMSDPSVDDVLKNVPDRKFKTSSFRIYFGFRF